MKIIFKEGEQVIKEYKVKDGVLTLVKLPFTNTIGRGGYRVNINRPGARRGILGAETLEKGMFLLEKELDTATDYILNN